MDFVSVTCIRKLLGAGLASDLMTVGQPAMSRQLAMSHLLAMSQQGSLWGCRGSWRYHGTWQCNDNTSRAADESLQLALPQ